MLLQLMVNHFTPFLITSLYQIELMKTSLLALFSILIVPSLCFGQSFKLHEPNVTKLKIELEKNNSNEVIYLYLSHYYKPSSDKLNVKKYDYSDDYICSFRQEFENKISYSIDQCEEAGGIRVTIELPKIRKEQVKQWVEAIYKAEITDIPNLWYSESNIYGPADEGVGCYYEIKPSSEQWIVEVYCGC